MSTEDALFHALASEHFSGIYSRFATATWARDAISLDVPSIHAEVRQGILNVVRAAHEDASPGDRVLLVKGEAGLGKTHCLTTELAKLARRGKAYPVLMQLAVDIDANELSRWFVKKIFDELATDKFVDQDGLSPLERLATILWSHAPDQRKRFKAKRDADVDEEVLDKLAVNAARKITKQLKNAGVTADDRVVVAGLLARADDCGLPFKAWVNGSSSHQSFGSLFLEPLRHNDQRTDVLLSLARICHATGAPFILAIDQIESTEQIGSLSLLESFLASAIQLCEDGIQGTGVIICALSDILARLPTLPASLRQRLEMQPAPVQMRPPKPMEIQRILQRRAQVLLERADIDVSEVQAADRISPAWLWREGSLQPRHVLESVRAYRERCIAASGFLSQDAFSDKASAPAGASQSVDFDKAWEDRRDQAVGGARSFSDEQRIELLSWLIRESALEIIGLTGTHLSRKHLGGPHPCRILRVEFLVDGEQRLEAWEIAFADAPVRGRALRRQIDLFLQHCTDASPAIFRLGTVSGFDGTEPNRSLKDLRRLTTGPALVNLLDAGGRVAPTEKQHWTELATAREFIGEFADAPAFADWRRERRFLTREVAIGPLASLARPQANPARLTLVKSDANGYAEDDAQGVSTGVSEDSADVADDDTPLAPTQALAELPAESDESAPPVLVSPIHARPFGDPRDTARMLIGHGDGERPIFWHLDQGASRALPNFGLTVSGDAGQGKTQIIKALLADAARLDCPTLVFDFKNDYSGEFARTHGFEVIDLQDGVPFNPFRPPPQGESGAQIMPHVFEVARVLATTLHLGEQQTALLRASIIQGFEDRLQPLREWLPVEQIKSPSLHDAITIALRDESTTATSLSNRLGLLHEMRLLPGDAGARLTFAELMAGRYVLSFNNLPNDDRLKSALAEMILIQLQGYMLRGEQPRALRRVLVFDEAWRASQSERLIQLAREGRAFGVAVVVGTQFPDDLSPDLVGNLASKLYLYNSDAQRRRRIVTGVFGRATGAEAGRLAGALAGLQQFDAVFSNQQHQPYVRLRVLPHFERE
ncbi:MAG: hypothetical protein AAF184_00020 [Pseudomonadota bacterium]